MIAMRDSRNGSLLQKHCFGWDIRLNVIESPKTVLFFCCRCDHVCELCKREMGFADADCVHHL